MQTKHIPIAALLGAILMAAGISRPALAQGPQGPGPQGQGQPAPGSPASEDMQRGVARISVMDGQVSVRRGDAGEWVAGVINAPLMADDSVATAPNSRAEIQFDSADILRIGGNAEIHLTALEVNRYQMELVRGNVTFRVLRTSNANVEVDTPSISVRPAKIGTYRISVNDSGETELTVRNGDVEVFSPKGSQWINAGQTMRARGAAADPEFQIVQAIPSDDWDRWSDSRDQTLMQASAAYRNVPPGVYGVEDMQNQGVWTEVPNYGQVWRPTAVPAGWAPYSCGRWVWEDYYGWTWIGCESWGWAPYHYGRWFFDAGYGGWLWYPGVIGVRHYWSPALVAFFGWGGGVGFGFGFVNIGWVALAPFELFHPWWGPGFYGAGFATRVNITNVNIYNTYRNARAFNGVSGVSAANFRGGQFGGISHVAGDQIRSAGLVRGQMPIGPSSANLRYSNSASAFTPRAGGAGSFFTHQQPSAVQHMAITQSLRSNAAAGRAAGGLAPAARTGGGNQFGTGRMAASGSAQPGAPSAARAEQNGASGGWTRFGTPAAQASQAGAARTEGNSAAGRQNPAMQNTRPPQAQGGAGNGWRGFGESSNGGHALTVGSQSAPYGAQNGRGTSNTPMRITPQVMHERQPSAPSYNAPRPAPSYNAPRTAPSNSAPRQSGGGNGGHASSGSGHSSGKVGRR